MIKESIKGPEPLSLIIVRGPSPQTAHASLRHTAFCKQGPQSLDRGPPANVIYVRSGIGVSISLEPFNGMGVSLQTYHGALLP